jgi:hypothetical protein
MSNLKNRVAKLESQVPGDHLTLAEALDRAQQRAHAGIPREPMKPTLTEAELNNILATNRADSLAAKLARAKLRQWRYIA